MLVRSYWPKCDCDVKEWTSHGVDAFWVEATEDEAKRAVFPLLSDAACQRSEDLALRGFHLDWKLSQPPRPYCFLVARDLSSVLPFQVHYPFHQLWNGHSPFRRLHQTSIDMLAQLSTIKCPRSNRDPAQKDPVEPSPIASKLVIPLLDAAMAALSQHDTALLDDVRWLKNMRSQIEAGDISHVQTAITASVFSPLLDIMKRWAAEGLNRGAAKGVPRSEKARWNLARRIRKSGWDYADHSLRDLVRHTFPIRQDWVEPHICLGRPVKGYWRSYPDPEMCKVPEALLSKSARVIYPYILSTPARKRSNWFKRRHPA